MVNVGDVYGRLTVMAIGYRGKNLYAIAACECGKVHGVYSSNLGKSTNSCGCLARELSSKRERTHGKSRTDVFRIWQGIKQRCLDTNFRDYPKYGGRGITVYGPWVGDFESFEKYIGPRPSPSHSVDRIDNNRGYEPGNVRWATDSEQQNNTSVNVVLTVNGATKTLANWSRDCGICANTITSRLRMGWSEHDAVTVPVKRKGL